MTAICDAIQSGRLNASIEIVISNKKNAFILERAKSCGIRAIHVAVNKRTREAYDEEISSILKEHNVRFFVLLLTLRLILYYSLDTCGLSLVLSWTNGGTRFSMCILHCFLLLLVGWT